jgi:uncharacterized RDD family membrane protein YckC
MRLFLWVNAAFIYDLLIIMALSFLLSAVFTMLAGEGFYQYEPWRSLFQLVWVLMIAGYYGYSWQKSGQTIGMKAWRLRVVRQDGSRLNNKDILTRLSAATLNVLLLNLGWLGYLSKAGLSLTDKLSATRIERIEKNS